MAFKAHPWHGVSIGDKVPDVVTASIEIVPKRVCQVGHKVAIANVYGRTRHSKSFAQATLIMFG